MVSVFLSYTVMLIADSAAASCTVVFTVICLVATVITISQFVVMLE